MVTECPDEQREILKSGSEIVAAIRSCCIREFCESAGIAGSVEALNLPDDVRAYRIAHMTKPESQ